MTARSKSDAEFRQMSKTDIPQLLEIERASFRAPWDENRFLEALNPRSGCKSVVLEDDGRVLGYFVVEIRANSLHISNLAVHAKHRRQGHASRCLAAINQLALKAFEIARSRDPVDLQPVAKRSAKFARATPDQVVEGEPAREGEIYLEVEESNLPAQLLYRKMNYQAVEILRNYYPSFHEDGYKMSRKVTLPSVKPSLD